MPMPPPAPPSSELTPAPDTPGRTTRTGKPPHAPGARPTSGATGPDLPLPHERDQAHGAARKTTDPVIEQAAHDVASGQVDTDMRAQPGLDAQRREQLVSTPQPQQTVRKPPR